LGKKDIFSVEGGKAKGNLSARRGWKLFPDPRVRRLREKVREPDRWRSRRTLQKNALLINSLKGLKWGGGHFGRTFKMIWGMRFLRTWGQNGPIMLAGEFGKLGFYSGERESHQEEESANLNVSEGS